MSEKIVIQLKPTELKHYVYIFSDNCEEIPVTKAVLMEELPSFVSMSAAKYNINHIQLYGNKEYTAGIKNILSEKINTCFGKDNNFIIELM